MKQGIFFGSNIQYVDGKASQVQSLAFDVTHCLTAPFKSQHGYKAFVPILNH